MNGNGDRADGTGPAPEVGEQVGRGLARIMEGVGADSVFGRPVEAGDRVVIPAATVIRAGGFGFGGGSQDEGDDGDVQSGGGGGGGGHALGRPVAAIDVGPEGVRVRPVIDFTHVGITVLVTLVALFRVLR